MTAPARPTVADLVDAGLRRLYDDLTRVRARFDRGQLTAVEWTAATARLYARRARWWTVLDRATVADHSVHVIYMRAVLAATWDAERDARHWKNEATTRAAEAVAEQRGRVR